MAEYSLSTACRWLGNSPTVAARHYAMTIDQDADFQQAVGPGAVKGAVADTGIGAQNRAAVLQNSSNTSVIRGKAHTCTVEHIDILGRGRIRTCEGISQRIYSPSLLAAQAHARFL